MKFAPESTEDWERFWLIALGTLVIGLGVFFGQSNYFVRRSAGEWLEVVLLLATAALGIYSAVLLLRGRIFLAALGFAMVGVGVWGSLPRLG